MPLFELNEPTTVAETIDAEAVVINLERGIYFSIRGLALAIWTNLLAGVPDTLIADSVRARHPGEARRVETDLAQFIDRLIEEGLIRRSARAANGSAVDLAFVPDGSYESPEIEKFTDMEALLLLDPIHDVDDTGWPSRQ